MKKVMNIGHNHMDTEHKLPRENTGGQPTNYYSVCSNRGNQEWKIRGLKIFGPFKTHDPLPRF